MILLKTAHSEHKYYGNILIGIDSEMIKIEAHSRKPHVDEDELMIWACDIYDWFWANDVISIRGEDDLHSGSSI